MRRAFDPAILPVQTNHPPSASADTLVLQQGVVAGGGDRETLNWFKGGGPVVPEAEGAPLSHQQVIEKRYWSAAGPEMASHEVVTCRGEELGATAGISARLFDPCDWVTIVGCGVVVERGLD